MKMTPEQLEFAISQYLDGTLPSLERDALDELLATDANARGLLEEYRRLDLALRGSPRAPTLKWDQLHRHLVVTIAKEAAPAPRSYQMPWLRNAQRVAIAASVVLVVGLGIRSYQLHTPGRVQPGGHAMVVIGPQSEAPTAIPVLEVAIGPAQTGDDQNWRYADSIIGRSTIVLIDRAFGPAQDIDPMPY